MIFASLLHNESNTKFLQMCHYLIITYTGKKVQRQGTLVSRAFPWLPTQSSLNAVPPLTSVYICTWLALTNSWSLLPTAGRYPLHSLCCLLCNRETPSNWVMKSKDCQLCTSEHPELNAVIRRSSGKALAAIPNSFKFCPLRHTQPGN